MISVILLLSFPAAVRGTDSRGTALITGRVVNADTGEYVETARVTLDGERIAFTDDTGYYRFAGVAAGPHRLEVFRTGLSLQSAVVVASESGTSQRDFGLVAARARPGDAPLQLEAYRVTASREIDAGAIAINEQRFARNMVNVVTTDEFGVVAEGNLGEFIKYLPGISVGYIGGDAQSIAMGGAPADNVPVSFAGFDIASAQSSQPSRGFQMEQSFSINNAARVEVQQSPTPESPGSALVGGVNVVPRSAFERTRPLFVGSTFIMMRDAERDFQRTPGPLRGRQTKVHPGFDFSYVRPVTRDFGFTVAGSSNKQYSPQDFASMVWRGTVAPTTGLRPAPAEQYPDTTPDRPYLSQFQVRDGGKLTRRISSGVGINWRPRPADRLSWTLQYAFFDIEYNNRSLEFHPNRVGPGGFSPYATQGLPGAGDVRTYNNARQKQSTTYLPGLTYRHDGVIWKTEVAAAYSHASNRYADAAKGYFNRVEARRVNVTVGFADIFYLRPGLITVVDPVSGVPVDPNLLGNYQLNTASESPVSSADSRRSIRGSVQRDFAVGSTPLAVKTGIDIREQARDIRGEKHTLTYRGPGPSAARFLDEDYSERIAPFGFGRIQWLSNHALYQDFKANPQYWAADPSAEYSNRVALSKHAGETVAASYVRGDIALLHQRLKLTAGVRVEDTSVRGEGRLIDPTRNYQRGADGGFVLGPNGRPLPLAAPGLATVERTNVDRGLLTRKEYLRWFPSLNAAYSFTDQTTVRAAYYHSLGRPSFEQYAGSLSLPDTALPPGPANRITVNNAAIKPWQARSYRCALEHYFAGVGLVSLGAYRRDFRHLFADDVLAVTPEFLEVHGLDQSYGVYDVATQRNLATSVRTTGLELNYRQALTALPHWARGLQVFANGTAQRTLGDERGALGGYPSRTWNAGVACLRERFTCRAAWNYRGRFRTVPFAGRGIEPGTYGWTAARRYLDLQAECRCGRGVSLFAELRNVGATPDDFEAYGPSTPEHAQFYSREVFGSLWTFGLKATF